jgi:subtilisin family serine protease
LGGGRFTEICDGSEYGRKAAIDKLREAGIATIISSGNNGYRDALSSPACISSAISVGATDDQDNVASFSNRADFLDLFAPGTSIVAPIPGGGTGTKQGTSMAAPHVTGAWAIIKQAHPDASVDQVLAVMKQQGEPVSDAYDPSPAPRLNVVQVVDADFTNNLAYQLYLPAIVKP